MRRMREFSWGILILALPLGAAVYGIHHVWKSKSGASHVQTGSVKSSHQAAKTDSGQGDERVSVGQEAFDAFETDRAPASDSEMGYADMDSLAEELLKAASAGGQCVSLEVPSDGRGGGNYSADDWSRVMKLFHGAKADLVKWLKAEKRHFSDDQLAAMEILAREVRIQRPPHPEEPDMHWRGTVTLTRDAQGESLIRVGSGFIHLVKKQPVRARFELARVIAQRWAPCELDRRQLGTPWAAMLSCLGYDEESTGCRNGAVSDAGWAISSLVASRSSDPGCGLPAFVDERVASCMKKFPVPSTEVAKR